MKEFKIPNRYLNITVPYHYYNDRLDIMGYIYRDRLFLENEYHEMFENFVGFYLEYHIEIDGKLAIVHSLEEVFEALLNNVDSFKIPSMYFKEYSEDEYKQIKVVHKYMKSGEKPKEYEVIELDNHKPNIFKRIKYYIGDYRYNRMLNEMKKYDYEIPTKVYSKCMNRDFYVVKGKPYWNVLQAFEDIYHIGFYYQYNGDGKDEYSNHEHQHDFDSVVRDVIRYANEFKIYDFQKKFFSKQELKFLNALAKRLNDINFVSVDSAFERDFLYNGPLAQDYYKYRDNHRYIKAFICDRKINSIIKKNRLEEIENHKIDY